MTYDCGTCTHLKICKYEGEYKTVSNEANDIVVEQGSPIKVTVKCSQYTMKSEQNGFRR